jgi:hypothetical protein
MKKAGVQLLEPIMKVEVVTPEDNMGDVIGDLNSRRGMVQEFTDKPGGMKVCAAAGPGCLGGRSWVVGGGEGLQQRLETGQAAVRWAC